jgi:hypothetical protein
MSASFFLRFSELTYFITKVIIIIYINCYKFHINELLSYFCSIQKNKSVKI